MSLFPDFAEAVFSSSGQYRYRLICKWVDNLPLCNFIFLYPGTECYLHLDPTCIRMRDLAKKLGYGGIIITNLFAYRASSVTALKSHLDPIGPDNNTHILDVAKQSHIVICAWGNEGRYKSRNDEVIDLLRSHQINLHYLSLNAERQPQHPDNLVGRLLPYPWHVKANMGRKKEEIIDFSLC